MAGFIDPTIFKLYQLLQGLGGILTPAVNAKPVDCPLIGDNIVHTPALGKRVQLFYICLSNSGIPASPTVVCTVRLGGVSLYKVSLVPGAIWAHNVKTQYGLGAVNADVVVNNSVAQNVIASIDYLEI